MNFGKRITVPNKLSYWDDATQTEKTIAAGEYEVEYKELGSWTGSQESGSVSWDL